MKIVAEIPDAMAPRVVRAIRAAHPALTDGLGDSAAVLAVIRWWTKSTVTGHETELVRQAMTAQVDLAERNRELAVTAAQGQVEAAWAAIEAAIPEIVDDVGVPSESASEGE